MGAWCLFIPRRPSRWRGAGGQGRQSSGSSGATGWPASRKRRGAEGPPQMFQLYHHGGPAAGWASELQARRGVRYKPSPSHVDHAALQPARARILARWSPRKAMEVAPTARPFHDYQMTADWADVEWLIKTTSSGGLKGSWTVATSRARGRNGRVRIIMRVQTHGGRQLDTAVSIDALQAIVEAWPGASRGSSSTAAARAHPPCEGAGARRQGPRWSCSGRTSPGGWAPTAAAGVARVFRDSPWQSTSRWTVTAAAPRSPTSTPDLIFRAD